MIELEKPNILVVDDYECNVIYIEKILESFDICLIKALSGPDAIRKTASIPLALALIDVEMPGMNGTELATIINRDRKENLIPIIFITAHQFDDHSLKRFYDYGIVDFIQKPFPVKILKKKVEIFLELHHQKRRLYESEKMYRTLLNASPEGIIVTDITGIIDQMSEITSSIFGIFDKNELIGSELQCLFPYDERSRLADIMQEAVEKGVVREAEFRINKADMTPIFCEISLTLIRGNEGSPLAFMAILRDITERKQMEKKMIQTERMVALGEMATGIAHEINQPLNILSLSVENILYDIRTNNHVEAEVLTRRSEKIFDSISRIEKIIDHIRFLSKDHHEYIESSFSVNDSILNALTMVSPLFSSSNIAIENKFDPSIPLICGSTYKFEQVLLNLLINSRDALIEKRESLAFDYEQIIQIKTYENAGHVVVEVTDNGSGIKPENIQKVMLPFFSTKKPGKGTGLGLSISFGIIREMKGEIALNSVHGFGTTVSITIPVTTTSKY